MSDCVRDLHLSMEVVRGAFAKLVDEGTLERKGKRFACSQAQTQADAAYEPEEINMDVTAPQSLASKNTPLRSPAPPVSIAAIILYLYGND
jgi:hypothetical protein